MPDGHEELLEKAQRWHVFEMSLLAVIVDQFKGVDLSTDWYEDPAALVRLLEPIEHKVN